MCIKIHNKYVEVSQVKSYIYIYGIHHWRIIWSSYRKLAWVGFEPMTIYIWYLYELKVSCLSFVSCISLQSTTSLFKVRYCNGILLRGFHGSLLFHSWQAYNCFYVYNSLLFRFFCWKGYLFYKIQFSIRQRLHFGL